MVRGTNRWYKISDDIKYTFGQGLKMGHQMDFVVKDQDLSNKILHDGSGDGLRSDLPHQGSK